MYSKFRLLLSICLLAAFCACSSNNDPQPANVSTTTTTNPATSQSDTSQPNAANANAAGAPVPDAAPPTTTNASPPVEATGGIDACTLLTGQEIAKVQGGAIKETKNNRRNDGNFLMSQCFYTADEFVRSVSLTVIQPNPSNPAKQPKEYFKERFRKAGEQAGDEREREREREREKSKEQKEKTAGQSGQGREEEEEEGGNAERINGVGEQAYWVKTGPTASLYVLRKNQFLILSIGGGDAEPVKLSKTKALAQQALKRLQ